MRSMYKVVQIGVLSLLLSLCSTLYAQQPSHSGSVIDEVIWVVGDEAILRSEIENQKLYQMSQGASLEGRSDCYLAEQIAVQMLFLNQAKIDSVSVDKNQVSRMVDNFMAHLVQQIGSRERLEEYFNRPYSQIREDQMLMAENNEIVRQMQQNIVKSVTVSPTEIRSYFSSIPSDSLPFIPLTVEVQALRIVPEIDVSTIDEIKARLRDYSDQVTSGQRDFSTLARLYSEDDNSSVHGGEYGFVSRAALEPEFAQEVFALSAPGQISPVIKTASGYHIVQLIERKENSVNFRHILLKPRVTDINLQAAFDKAKLVEAKIRDGKESFEEAVLEESNVEDSKNNFGLLLNEDYTSNRYGTALFTMEELPQDFSQQVNHMQEGEISSPFLSQDKNGNPQVIVLYLRKRINAHRANMTSDFQVIKQMALEYKKQSQIDDWITERLKTTYVKLSPEFKSCNFHYSGWIKK